MRSVEELLGRMLGPSIAHACALPGAVPFSSLAAVEAASVARAAPSRRREMAAGRAAARAALARLGIDHAVVPRSPCGAPVWPDEVAGSITHTRTLALAVVTRDPSIASIGVDAEPDAPLDEELWPALMTAAELARVRALSPAMASARVRSLFCAKEAAYKCQYPVTGLMLDFEDLEIQLIEGGETVRFDAIFQRNVPPFRRGDRIPGRIGRAGGYVVATAVMCRRDREEVEDPSARPRARVMTFDHHRERVFGREG